MVRISPALTVLSPVSTASGLVKRGRVDGTTSRRGKRGVVRIRGVFAMGEDGRRGEAAGDRDRDFVMAAEGERRVDDHALHAVRREGRDGRVRDLVGGEEVGAQVADVPVAEARLRAPAPQDAAAGLPQATSDGLVIKMT